MNKVILVLFLMLVIAVGAVSYYVFTNLDALVEAAIEKYGSEATHTAVKVDRVKISLTEGSGAIYGITVGNPAGFSDPNIFSLGEVSTKINYESVKREIIIVDEIKVLAPQVFFEVNKDKQANLNVLKNNLGSGQTATPTAKETPKSAEGAQPRLIIRHVRFAEGNIQARVVPLNNKTYNLKLPTIDMKDLGSPNGAPPDVIAKQIVSKLTDEAKAEIRKQGIDKEIEKLKAQAQQKIDEEKAKLKSKADSTLEKEAERAKDKLKSLLGR